ncbi:MAG TPA: glycoside hydrolase family 3 N-terminal domain-containing protein, partial [Steroidobacteraceae bacterium]|nr:glycoside hydrolase family 3 N-terminal domain-containing protein [Steroidobacteraceae bacterium]
MFALIEIAFPGLVTVFTKISICLVFSWLIVGGAVAAETSPAASNSASEARINQILAKLTLEEKVSLLSGISGFDTASIERLGIRGMTFSDGAHGVRANDGTVATVYPVGIALASTWNVAMAQSMGKAIGEEAREHDVQVMLGPNINLVRSPLAGRNFETFGEDPVLTSRIGVGYVQGMQSTGVSATPKHFIGNEQETERFRGSSNIDERTLNELYLVPFESVVREAHPWALMTAYNRLNGTFMTEHGELLKQLLKKEWGFDGVVMSDWGAAHSLNVISSGLDLEMPGPAQVLGQSLINAVYYRQVSEAAVNDAARRMLRLYARTGHLDAEQKTNKHMSELHVQEHHKLACDIATEALVLLKNDHDALPLDANKIKRVAVIGPNADAAIVQGSGSSQVLASEFVTPLQAIRAQVPSTVKIDFEAGVDNEWSPRVLDARYFSPTRDHKQIGLLANYYANANGAGKPVLSQVETNIGGMSFGGVITARGGRSMSAQWTGFFFAPHDGEYELSLEHLDVNAGSNLAGEGVKLGVH